MEGYILTMRDLYLENKLNREPFQYVERLQRVFAIDSFSYQMRQGTIFCQGLRKLMDYEVRTYCYCLE